MSTSHKPPQASKSQAERFRETARQLECDEDKLGRIAMAKPARNRSQKGKSDTFAMPALAYISPVGLLNIVSRNQ
jgi:hypothetical protein